MKRYFLKRIVSKGHFVIIWTICAAGLFAMAGGARAAVLEATPKLMIDFYYNDNIYADDPDEILPANPGDNTDIATAAYIHYLVGIMFRYRQGQSTAEISGNIGYSQYLAITGWVEDAKNNQPADYNSMHGQIGGLLRYTTRNVIFELDDYVNITRNLQTIFGDDVDAFGYWSLFTDNVAGLNVKYSPSPKTRMLLRYSYDTLIFSDPENDVLPPPDSVEQRGVGRIEYDFTGKTTGILDGQFVSRTYASVEDRDYADYIMYTASGGLRYRINSESYIEGVGGYYFRTFENINKRRTPLAYYPTAERMYDLDDVSNPTARITFGSSSAKVYSLVINGTYGMSTYGQDLYFTYTGVNANFNYYITPKLQFSVYGGYSQSLYDLEQNSREWLWKEDRLDNITQATAKLKWDILQKGGQGTLTAEVGYSMIMRDSNVDSRDDYNPNFQNWMQASHGTAAWPYDSYDSTMNVFYVEFVVLPTILIGD